LTLVVQMLANAANDLLRVVLEVELGCGQASVAEDRLYIAKRKPGSRIMRIAQVCRRSCMLNSRQ